MASTDLETAIRARAGQLMHQMIQDSRPGPLPTKAAWKAHFDAMWTEAMARAEAEFEWYGTGV